MSVPSAPHTHPLTGGYSLGSIPRFTAPTIRSAAAPQGKRLRAQGGRGQPGPCATCLVREGQGEHQHLAVQLPFSLVLHVGNLDFDRDRALEETQIMSQGEEAPHRDSQAPGTVFAPKTRHYLQLSVNICLNDGKKPSLLPEQSIQLDFSQASLCPGTTGTHSPPEGLRTAHADGSPQEKVQCNTPSVLLGNTHITTVMLTLRY